MNYSAGAVSKALIFFLLFSTTALFAQTNWEGDVDSDWNNGLNWVGDVLPADGTDVVIDATIYTNAPDISVNSTFSPGKVTIQNGGVLSISADLTTSDNFQIDGNNATNPSVTMTTGTLAIGAKTDIKKGGVFNISGGVITSADDFKLDGNGNNTTKINMTGGTITGSDKVDIKKKGIFTMSGGTLTSTAEFKIDNGIFIINEDDGTSTVTASANFTIKTSGGKSLTYMSAGTFDVTGDLTLDGNKKGGAGSAAVTVAGGTFTANALTLFSKEDGDSAVFKVSGGTATLVGVVEDNFNADPTKDGTIDIVVEGGTLIFQDDLVMDETDDQMTQTGGTIQFEGGDKDWTLNGDFTSTGGNVTFNDATKTELIGIGTYNFFDIIINSGRTVNQLTSNINVAGDWTNNGGTFNEGLSKVTFNGSGAQTITNTLVETFYEFTLDKAAETLSLADNVIISATLTMSQGQLDASSNRLTLGTGLGNEGTLSYTAGQIEGQFERWINNTATDYLFPLGIGSATRMNLNFTNLTGGSIISEFFSADPGGSGLPLAEAGLTIDPQYPEGYWQVSAANSLASTDYNVRVFPIGFATFYKGAPTRLLKRANGASAWVLDGTHVAYDIMTVEAGRDNLTTGIATAEYGIAVSDCAEPTTTSITGSQSECISAADIAYSVTNTAGSTYNWTITGGTQDTGGNTNSITVDWGGTGGNKQVQVEEINSCGNNKFVTLLVVLNPAPTSAISGNDEPCPGTPENYSVTNRTGYTYTWVITGGTKTAGGTTNSISVEWDVANAGANIDVTASSPSCGDAAVRSLPIVVAGYTSSTVDQPNTTSVDQFATNAEIIEIQIVQAAGSCSDTVTQFNLDTDGGGAEGTDNPATNITTAKIYYTGSTQGFTTATLFGSVSSPSGTFSITGSQALLAGETNYFYLAYDIPLTAIVTEKLDAQLVSFQFGAIVKTDMTISAPSGSREITAATIYHSFGTGNWTDGNNWSLDGGTSTCTCEPNGSGLAIIQSGHDITADADRSVDHLLIEDGGVISAGGGKLTILDRLNTEGSGFFSLDDALTVSGPAALMGTGSSTSNQKMTFNNDLDVGSGTSLTETAGQDVLVKGNLVVDGTIAISGKKKLKLDGVGATTISGAGFITSLDSAAQLEIKNGDKTILAGTNLTISPEIKLNNANVYNYGTITTIESAVVKQGSIDATQATDTWFNYTGSTVNYAGALLFFRSKGVLDASATGNTVNYNRDDTQQIAGMTYYNMTVTSATGTRIKTLDGDAIIGGDLTISGTTQLDNGILINSIILAGDWNNTSSIGDSFVEGDGLVTLNGSAAQTITNTTGETYSNLTINNSLAGNGVVLDDPIMVSTALTLTDGVILSTATNKISLATAATSSGYTNASFINGPMTYNSLTSTSVTFPVGKDSELHRLDLTVDGTSSNYTTEYIHSSASALGFTLPITLDLVSLVGYWDLSRDAGGSVTAASVDLYYNNNDGVSDTPNLRVAKDDGASNWVDQGGTGSSAPSGNILSTDFTTFSFFSLANNLGGNNALPVELVYFTGKLLAKGVVLEWQTASELNNDFFEIEVSSDGENYATIANIRGQGTTTAITNYEFVDRYPDTGLNYYRLRQVDFNGDFEYSNIISVLNDAPPKLYYSAYPQPASTHLTLQIRAIDETNEMNLFIYNINGRIIKHITLAPKTKQLPVDISAFTNGLYLVRLNQAAQAYHGRLLIQK